MQNDTMEPLNRNKGGAEIIIMHLPGSLRKDPFKGQLYALCLLCLALAVIAVPSSAGELKIYTSEGIKKITTPEAPADAGSASLPSYRYAGERCLSGCNAAPAAAETAAPREKQTEKRPMPRLKDSAGKRSCST